MQELEEIHLDAFDNELIYKERSKMYHDRHLSRKNFKIGDKVLLYNTKLHLFPGKLRSRWLGPFIVTKVFENGAIAIESLATSKIFTVNRHRLKLYREIMDNFGVEHLTLEDAPSFT